MQTANPVAGEAPPFTFWFTYLVICVLIVCLGTQIVFLNKAISCFSIHVVTPVLYVEFTSLSLTASAILYREFNGLESDAVLSIGLGFFVVIVGLFLMCSFRDLKFGWSNWVAYVLELQIPNADPNPDPDAGAVDVDEAVEVVEQPNLQHSPPPVPSSMILKRTESNCSSNTSTLSSSDSDFLSAARNGLSLGRKSGPLSTIAELPSNSSIAGADEQSQPPPKTTAPRKSRKKRLFRFTLGDRFRGVDTGSPLASASSGAGSSSVPQSVRRKPWTLITDLNGYGSRKRALRAAGSQQSAGASGTRTASLELSVRAAAVLSSANSLGTVDSGFCSEAAVAPKGSNPNLNSVDLLRRPRNPFPAHAAPDSADPSSSVPRDHIAIALEELPPRSLLHQVLLSGSAPAEKKTSTTSAADTSVPVPRLPPPAPIVANGVGVGTRRGSASPEGAIASRVAYNSMPAAEEPVC